jgi:hypothetical protein
VVHRNLVDEDWDWDGATVARFLRTCQPLRKLVIRGLGLRM